MHVEKSLALSITVISSPLSYQCVIGQGTQTSLPHLLTCDTVTVIPTYV